MSIESYKTLQDSVLTHKVVIDDLIRENETLKLQLEAADAKIANLTVKVIKSETGEHELIVQLEDANGEVGRLGMVLKHQSDNLTSIQRLSPKKHE